MSLLKKLFLTGSLLVTVFVMIAPTPAQDWDGRLWKPYQPQQFGGHRRGADGLYFSIDAIFWKIDAPKNIYNKAASEDNTLSASQVPYEFSLGTRLVVGNRHGHHGWRFSGFAVDNSGSSSEPDRWQWRLLGKSSDRYYSWWDTSYMLFTNDLKSYRSTTKVADFDVAWTYRTHPFSWGEIEFFVGAKYRDITDKLTYSTVVSSDPWGNGHGNTLIYEYSDWGWGYWLDSESDTDSDSNSDGSSGLTPVELSVGENVSFQAKNRFTGVHLGFELTRQNSRWTFGVAPSVFLGTNNQSYTFSEGTQVQFEPRDEVYELTSSQLRALEFAQGEIAALQGTTFYRRSRTVFSPGGTLQLTAKWQWTNALAIKLGFDASVMGNVGRGSDLVATPVMESTGEWSQVVVPVMDSSGQPITVYDTDGNATYKTETKWVQETKRTKYDFSLRSKGETLLMYGVSIGLELRR